MNNTGHRTERKSLPVLLSVLLLIAFLIIIGGGRLLNINWGLDQIGLFPAYFQIIWGVLLLTLTTWIFIGKDGQSALDVINRYLWGDRKKTGRIALLTSLALIFIVFRFEAHLYGEGYIRISNISQRAVPIFRWYEFGGTFLPYIFFLPLKAVGVVPETAAAWGFQIVSFLSGLFYTFILFIIGEKISTDLTSRTLFFFLAILSGLTLFFFGMVEVYSPLISLAALFILQAFRYYEERDSKQLILLWLVIPLGIFFHIIFAALIPAALFATVNHFINDSKRESITALVVSIVSVFGAVAVIYLLASGDIAIAKFFLTLSGKPPHLNYGIFRLTHLTDLLNLLITYAPLFALFGYFSATLLIKKQRRPLDTFLGILRLSQFVLIFILVPLNGMAREIPLYGFLFTGAIIFGAYAVAVSPSQEAKKTKHCGIILLALLLVLPTYLTHLMPAKTVAHIDRFLTYNEAKYESSLLAMRDYYYMTGDFTEADRREQMIPGKSKTALESQLVEDLFVHERVNDAYTYAVRLVEGNPYVGHYRMQLGNLLKYFKRYAEAEEQLKLSIALEPYNGDYYYFLAQLYDGMNLKQKSFETLTYAYSFAPDNVSILTGLAAHHNRLGELDRADDYAERAVKIDPDAPYPYMFKGLICESRGELQQALDHYTRFVRLNENLPEVPDIRRRMNNIVLKMREMTTQN